MVSCSGFGLPLHAQLLRLFVTKRRSRDSYSNRAYSRTQTVRNTGTHNLPLYLTRATIRTNDLDTLVHIGDLSPRQHRTARSSCQEVSTTTIHRPLTLDQRHAEFPMCTSQEGTFSHRWPAGCSHSAESVQVNDNALCTVLHFSCYLLSLIHI